VSPITDNLLVEYLQHIGLVHRPSLCAFYNSKLVRAKAWIARNDALVARDVERTFRASSCQVAFEHRQFCVPWRDFVSRIGAMPAKVCRVTAQIRNFADTTSGGWHHAARQDLLCSELRCGFSRRALRRCAAIFRAPEGFRTRPRCTKKLFRLTVFFLGSIRPRP